ncbi:uncharacterized protein LOC143482637 isoform X4 [Brachyhypopomus gauderio]|uniref:uncharacterized protein LOC143482637 isoform X4 n=1 Tax=Brachyhypopomus gauderio TaxID=698409 RepID=UPI004041BFFC
MDDQGRRGGVRVRGGRGAGQGVGQRGREAVQRGAGQGGRGEGGKPSRFTPAQEVLIVDMVRENNMIRLLEIQERIFGDNVIFQNIDNVSLTTIDRVLKCQRVHMKQAYRVPFERNSDRIKHLRHQYVQRIFELESMARPQEFIFVDEAGFNLNKRRRRGRNIIGRRAIVDVPGQRGGNITLCAAMSSRGLLHRHAELGAYNTERLLTFLGELRDVLYNNDLFLMRSCGPTQPDDVMPPNDFSVNIQHTVSIYRNRTLNIVLDCYCTVSILCNGSSMEVTVLIYALSCDITAFSALFIISMKCTNL